MYYNFGVFFKVSSFETRSRDAKDKKMDLVSFKSGVFAEKDFLLWRDAMSRDFTINRYNFVVTPS